MEVDVHSARNHKHEKNQNPKNLTTGTAVLSSQGEDETLLRRSIFRSQNITEENR